jgi:O-antigen/teichoic acid export membrane protein
MINKLKYFFKNLSKSEFTRNVSKLTSATAIAQLISIGTAPILYRIYEKEDYGTLGLYMAITGVLGVFSTLQFNQTILIAKEDGDAKTLMWLNRSINLVLAIVTLLVVLNFGNTISKIFGNPNLLPWLYFAPISLFFAGQGEIFSIWANRNKKYKILAINGILTAVMVPVVSISIGVFNNGPMGLFLGLLTSQVLPTFILLFSLTKNEDLGFSFFDLKKIKVLANRYKKFPFYNLPSEFINRLTNQLPVFMLSSFVGPAAVGLYNLAVRMIGLPIQLIGGAISTVFRQRATEDYNKNGTFRSIYVKTLKTLSIIAIPMFLLIIMLGPQLFAFVFGSEWKESGVIAQILMGMFVMKLIVSPLSYTWFIVERLRESFFIHNYMLVSNILIFYVGFTYLKNYQTVLFAYSINYIMIYVYSVIRTYHFSHNLKLRV